MGTSRSRSLTHPHFCVVTLTLSYFCVCPKISNVICHRVFLVLSELSWEAIVRLVGWYCWNCWPSLFKLSFITVQNIVQGNSLIEQFWCTLDLNKYLLYYTGIYNLKQNIVQDKTNFYITFVHQNWSYWTTMKTTKVRNNVLYVLC